MNWFTNFFSWIGSIFNSNEIVEEPQPEIIEEDNEINIETENNIQQSTTIILEDIAMPEKYALLVGVNKYQTPGNDLRGCVNDVVNMRNLLIDQFGFKNENIRVIVDERATFDGICERLEWLIFKAKPGDQLVFHFSGHGSQIVCRNYEQELDGLTELICPHDMDWDRPFTDDILADYFKSVPEGAYLTFIADCCHSGTISRSEFGGNPHPILPKRMIPPIDILMRESGKESTINKIGVKGISEKIYAANVQFIEQKHILFSGCRDDQTSSDAFIAGQFQGALTANLITALKKEKDANWINIHDRVITTLKAGGFTQVPQLSGDSKYLNGKLFE